MNSPRLLAAMTFAALAALPSASLLAQCTNPTQYPADPVHPNTDGTVTQIAACSFEEEYSRVTDIYATVTYEFTLGTGNYITVHQGTYDGPVVAQGLSPVQATAVTNEDLFAHWNTNDQCGTNNTCAVTTVRIIQNCTPPSFTTSTVNDCANNQFSVVVDVTGLGDAPSVNIAYNSVNGVSGIVNGVGLGQQTVGPFTSGDIVSVVVQHGSDPACNVPRGGITNFPCPIISCGPDYYNYCYQNNDTVYFVYQGSSTDPLLLRFLSGGLYQFGGDLITIYDGFDPSAPVIYQGFGIDGNLAGVQAISTNPDHALCLELIADGFGSCSDGFANPEWNYVVGCYNCIEPLADFQVITDCDNQNYTVLVNIYDMGSDPTLDIENTGGAPTINATEPNTYTSGPFQVGQPTTVTIVNDQNALCSVSSGPLINDFCAIVSCGPDNYHFCYDDNLDTLMVFQSTNTYPIAILFNAGQVESCCDFFTVYDGPDDTYPVLYNGNGNFGDMTGVFVVTSPDNLTNTMTVVFHSDGSVSCHDNGFTELDYTVSCLDCVAPSLTYDVDLDCDNNQFYVTVDITSLGTDPAMDITNDGGAPPQLADAVGVYTVGPFADGQHVHVNVENDSNPLCSSHSPLLTNFPCPVISCGPNNYVYCYPNSWDSITVYQSANTYPIALVFNSGNLESCCDNITVYDGLNDLAPMIYQGNGNFGDLTDLFFASTNTDNALTVVWHSDGSINCADGIWGFNTLDWTVSCLDCTNPEATFELVPDCIHHGFQVAVNVTNTGTSNTVRIANSWAPADTLENVGLGTTMVGPIPVDSIAKITVLNQVNPLCRIFSEEFTFPLDSCVIPSCAATTYEYCYTNSDTAYYTYQSSEGEPLTINFLWGQLLVNDYLQVFDGFDQYAPMIYMGNQGGDMGGLAVNSTNPDNALTLRVVSSPTGSCSTGQAHLPLHWVIECGEVNIDEAVAPQDFAMYPNPTSGELYVRLPENTKGMIDVRIVDVAGRIVNQQSINASLGSVRSLDLQSLQSGNYTVVLTTKDWVRARQLQLVR